MAADAYTTPDWPRSVCVTLSLPPSWNNALHAVPGRGRVLSAEARAWKEQAGWLTRAAMAGCPPLRPPLTVWLFAYGLSRRRDLDGIIKLTQDSILDALGIDDRYVDEVYAVRVLSRDGPRLDVVVSELTREERA